MEWKIDLHAGYCVIFIRDFIELNVYLLLISYDKY